MGESRVVIMGVVALLQSAIMTLEVVWAELSGAIEDSQCSVHQLSAVQ